MDISDDVMQFVMPCAFLPAFIASLFAMFHASNNLPKTLYASILQCALGLNVACDIAGAAYYYSVFEIDNIDLQNNLNTLYNGLFLIYNAVYFFAQFEFLQTFVKIEDGRVARITVLARVIVSIATFAGIYSAFSVNILADDDPSLKVVLLTCIAINMIMNVIITTFTVQLVLRKHMNQDAELRKSLSVTCVAAITTFVLSISMFNASEVVADGWNAMADLFANLYAPISYLSVIIIRKVLASNNARIWNTTNGIDGNAKYDAASYNPNQLPPQPQIVQSVQDTSVYVPSF